MKITDKRDLEFEGPRVVQQHEFDIFPWFDILSFFIQ